MYVVASAYLNIYKSKKIIHTHACTYKHIFPQLSVVSLGSLLELSKNNK